jgi:SlyX protein
MSEAAKTQPGLVVELTNLNNKVMDLEIKLSYQDEALQAMEQTIAAQHQSIQGLERKLTLLAEYLKSLKEDPIKPLSEEVPPPHY